MLWLSLLSSTLYGNPIEVGKKVEIALTFGESLEGRISSFSKDCITLRNAKGDRSIDVRLIESVRTEEQFYTQEQFSDIFVIAPTKKASVPRNEILLSTGLLNAGFPLWFLPDNNDALGVTILDGIFLGAGLYSIQEEPIVALPIFLGLGGLRVWSISKSISKANHLRDTPISDTCKVIGK